MNTDYWRPSELYVLSPRPGQGPPPRSASSGVANMSPAHKWMREQQRAHRSQVSDSGGREAVMPSAVGLQSPMVRVAPPQTGVVRAHGSYCRCLSLLQPQLPRCGVALRPSCVVWDADVVIFMTRQFVQFVCCRCYPCLHACTSVIAVQDVAEPPPLNKVLSLSISRKRANAQSFRDPEHIATSPHTRHVLVPNAVIASGSSGGQASVPRVYSDATTQSGLNGSLPHHVVQSGEQLSLTSPLAVPASRDLSSNLLPSRSGAVPSRRPGPGPLTPTGRSNRVLVVAPSRLSGQAASVTPQGRSRRAIAVVCFWLWRVHRGSDSIGPVVLELQLVRSCHGLPGQTACPFQWKYHPRPSHAACTQRQVQ